MDVFHVDSDNGTLKKKDTNWKQLHKRYTVGTVYNYAFKYAHKMNLQNKRVLISALGEKNQSIEAAVRKTKLYCSILRKIEQQNLNATISIKLSDIGLKQSIEFAYVNLKQILDSAPKQIIEIDMEYRELVSDTLLIADRLLREGYVFKLAVQSGRQNIQCDVALLLSTARCSSGSIGFRIVTGSCYKKNGSRYSITLETCESKTIMNFYDLMFQAQQWTLNGGLVSSVGTYVVDRMVTAARAGLELQFLKGDEHTKAYAIAEELHKQNGAQIAMYAGFGRLDDPGVRAYLLRRIQ